MRRKPRPTLTVVTVSLLGIFAANTWGQEWTRFRGPQGGGSSVASALPVLWSDADVAWKITLPGEGHSSPVLWGDRVFLTAWDKEQGVGVVMAIEGATGRILWQTAKPMTRSRLHGDNSPASSTPAVSPDRLFVPWLEGDPANGDQLSLTALDHDGRHMWKSDLGRVHSQHGLGTSPIVYGDLVILAQEQRGENNTELQGRWLGIDQSDGTIRWQLARENAKISYSTPSLLKDASGRDQLIFSSNAHGITAIDPTRGKVLWEVSDCFVDRTVGSPLVAGGLVVGTAGGGGVGKRLVIVKPGHEDLAAKVLFTTDIKGQIPYVPSTIAIGNRLYLFQDRGSISCWDLRTGEAIWTDSIKARFYGSPVASGDMLYCVTRKGEAVVVKSADTFQLMAVNPLGEACQTTPAISDNRLYIRTVNSLICISRPQLSKARAIR